jgi:dolichol-phosphate mannosyltransferase
MAFRPLGNWHLPPGLRAHGLALVCDGELFASLRAREMTAANHMQYNSSAEQRDVGSICRTNDTLVFAPTYNERAAIGPLLRALLVLPHDILIVDDNSFDGTTDILLACAARSTRVKVIVRPGKFGVGSAHRLAWLHARQRGYSCIVTLDADLSHDPEDVQRLLNALDSGADFAIGSRFMSGGQLDYRGWRWLLSNAANHLARLLFRLPITEYTTSFRAARLARVPQGLIETIEEDGYGFFLSCVAQLARRRLAIVEIPIRFRVRRSGKSKLGLSDILRGAVNLLRLSVARYPSRHRERPQCAQFNCPACGLHYLVVTTVGTIHCLACFGRGSTEVRDAGQA